MSPDFSIITPSYNYAKYVREMLDSVAGQEGVTFEHIVYDAGSTDGTLDVLREYDHVSLFVEPDEGMSDAINKGFKKAKGEWVMWLNTDDMLHPGALKEVLRYARQNEDADVIFGGWHFVDEAGNLTKKNFDADDVDGVLRLQLQFAESRTIKRVYGHTVSADDNLNILVDSVFYVFFRLLKPVLKIANKWRLEN